MAQHTLLFPIIGMHCPSCEAVINIAVQELPGINTVSADYIAKKVHVRFDDCNGQVNLDTALGAF